MDMKGWAIPEEPAAPRSWQHDSMTTLIVKHHRLSYSYVVGVDCSLPGHFPTTKLTSRPEHEHAHAQRTRTR